MLFHNNYLVFSAHWGNSGKLETELYLMGGRHWRTPTVGLRWKTWFAFCSLWRRCRKIHCHEVDDRLQVITSYNAIEERISLATATTFQSETFHKHMKLSERIWMTFAIVILRRLEVTISHFRVAVNLIMKVRQCAKLFIRKLASFS